MTQRIFLVAKEGRLEGEFWVLEPPRKTVLGRHPLNQIVLHDDLSSRQHAEIYPEDKGWGVRDLNSRNGTKVNGRVIHNPVKLKPEDVIRVGDNEFVFTLKSPETKGTGLSESEEPQTGLKITGKLSQSRFLTDSESTLLNHPQASRDLSRLYRLGLAMGAAEDLKELTSTVLSALIENTHATSGAVLMIEQGGDVDLLAYQGPDTYHKVSEYISGTVLREKQGVLAQDVSADGSLKNRASLEDIGAESLICAPIVRGKEVIGVAHLYSSDPTKALNHDDLNFTLAVLEQFSQALNELNQREELQNENQNLRHTLQVETELVGDSSAIEDIKNRIAQVAPMPTTVLIRGESGVGKELVARGIHFNSPRSGGPMICLNCAALTETLLESELFGHEKGAFTGATEQKIGKFEAADGGTIFLDEIGEMNINTQAKFLRVLEGQAFERVGGSKPISVNVRVVAATNVNLEVAVNQNKFRSDLYFRLQVVPIVIPPLRDRRDDITMIANFFLDRLRNQIGRKISDITPSAMKKMVAYDWPGNVRELRNVIERAVVLGNTEVIQESDILLTPLGLPERSGEYRSISLEEIEKEHIEATLKHTEWNKSQAASILGIERSTLDRKINRYSLSK